MLNKLSRPYLYFLLTGILLLIACFCVGDRNLDINVHDTYFVIAYTHVGIAFFLIHGFYTGIYFLMRRYANAVLSFLHFIFSLPLFIVLYLSTFFMFGAVPRRYYENGDPEFFNFGFLNDPRGPVISLFLIAQLVFVFNIILVLVRAYRARA
jgi:heme/copper-type cytochrome/quinol oxidase subunit 1